jgi:hypothetical protein
MRLKLMSIPVVVLLVIAAGCGGSSKKAATTTTAAATTTEAATTTGASTTLPSNLNLSSKACQQLLGMGQAFSKALSGTGGKDTNKTIDALAQALNTYAKSAPSEIRGDFEIYAKAFGEYAKALKSGDIAQMQKMAATFSQAKFQAASQHISTWAEKACTK